MADGAEGKPSRAWSWTRHRMHAECARRYWLRYHLARDGWAAGADALSRQAWMLSKLVTFPQLVGQLVHDILREIAVEIGAGRPSPPLEPPRRAAVARLRRVRRTTRKEFTRDPARSPMLDAAFYGTHSEDEIAEMLHEAEEALAHCLDNALELTLWEELRGAVRVRPPDRIETRTIHVWGERDEVLWYGAPDLALYPASRATVDVVDYKTGATAHVHEAQVQLHVYAAFLIERGARWDERWRGRVIHLRTGTEDVVALTAQGVDDVRALIERDVRAWRRAGEGGGSIAPMEAFPLTEQRGRCASCALALVCQELRNPGGRIGLPEA